MNAIKEFWMSSYRSDKVAFYFEMASFIFILFASMTMAITADSPDMRYIYPGYFIGSLTSCVCTLAKKTSMANNVSWIFYNRKCIWLVSSNEIYIEVDYDNRTY